MGTTQAVDLIKGGVKGNALPERAEGERIDRENRKAVYSFRILLNHKATVNYRIDL